MWNKKMKGCKLQLVPPVTGRPRSTPPEQYATSEVIFLCGNRNLSAVMSFNSALNLLLLSTMNSESNWEPLEKSAAIGCNTKGCFKSRTQNLFTQSWIKYFSSWHRLWRHRRLWHLKERFDLLHLLWNNDKPNHTHKTNWVLQNFLKSTKV